MKPRAKILIIAGSDSSGGAGIQADIKTVSALGGYAMTAVTAITAQNTTGVKSIVAIPPKKKLQTKSCLQQMILNLMLLKLVCFILLK